MGCIQKRFYDLHLNDFSGHQNGNQTFHLPIKRFLDMYKHGCYSKHHMQVETNKEKSLQRRVQSLQRFLLEQLRSELVQRKQQATSAATSAATSSPSKAGAAKERAAGISPANGDGTSGTAGSTGAAAVGEKYDKADASLWPSAEKLLSQLDGLFGLFMHQLTTCLTGSKAQKTQLSLSLQAEHPRSAMQPEMSYALIFVSGGKLSLCLHDVHTIFCCVHHHAF